MSWNSLLTFLLSYHVWVTSKIQVNFRFERYWWYCLINCWNSQTFHVFEVRESIADISTELSCSSYLKNLGQLPVQGYLKGTDNCILCIFTISSLFMFSRSRNSLLTFLLGYDVWVTSIIQVNFRFERYWWFCLMNFWNFHTIRVLFVFCFVGLGSSVGWTPAELTYVFAKGVSDQVRDPRTPRNSLQ